MDQRRHLRGIHLTIGIDLDDYLGAALDGVTHAGEERCTNALVKTVHNDDHPGIATSVANHDAGPFRATVVDDNDQPDFGADRLYDRQDGGCRVKRWNDDTIHG